MTASVSLRNAFPEYFNRIIAICRYNSCMSKFSEKVLGIVKSVPYGKVVSYGQVALMAGIPRAAIQVGWVLHTSGHLVPWWRVINNSGRISIKHPEHTTHMQKALLEKEGVKVTKDFRIDIDNYRYRPSISEIENLSLDPQYIENLSEKYNL